MRKNEYLLPEPLPALQPCKHCNKLIYWIVTERGRPMPLSAETRQCRDGRQYALPHFADCAGWQR